MSSLRRLVVFGDSFVEGYTSYPERKVTPFNMCYFLEKELNVEVVNCGRRGSGNAAIANKIFRYIQSNDITNTSILVVWSGIDRPMELNREYTGRDFDCLLDFDYPDYIVGGSTRYEELRLPLQEYQNIATLRLNAETAYHSVRMICLDYDIPFLMINSFDNTLLVKKGMFEHKIRYINYIQGKLKDCWIEPENYSNTLLDIISDEWLMEREEKHNFLPHKLVRVMDLYRKEPINYPNMTKCIHPTESGNELIAKTLKPYILPLIQE